MAAQQAVALMLIVVAAYYVASYWRKLMLLLAVLVISVFGFGVYTLALTFNSEAIPGKVVQIETTSYQC
ncbi:hypothetical protein ACWGID_03015 [Kribbella sp. NPDC054772]